MGFVRKRKLYAIDLTGTSLEGLDLVMCGLTVRESLTLSGLQDMAEAPAGEQAEKLRELFEFVAGKIARWNLEAENPDGTREPVAPSADELMSWDTGEAFAIIAAWQKAVEGVSDPLERRSSAGSRWEGEPIPMAIPSPSLPN